MKKYLFLALAVIGLMLSSCNRIDGNLVGTWKSISNDNESSVMMSGQTTLIINQDGSFSRSSEVYSNGVKLPDMKLIGTWEQEGDELKLVDKTSKTGEPFVMKSKIKKLTETELVLDEWEYHRIK